MTRDMLELDIGRAILTTYAGGFLQAQFDSESRATATSSAEAGGTSPAEVLSPFGFDSRPQDTDTNSDGTPGKGATCMRAFEGQDQHMWVFGDCRCTPRLPQLSKGSCRIYAHRLNGKLSWTTIDGITGNVTTSVDLAGGGTTTSVTDGATGDVTITHASGTKMSVRAADVELGADGGAFVALAPALMAWIVGVLIPALAASPGGPITVTAPTGIAALKVKAT